MHSQNFMTEISSIEEYDYALSRGFEPLLDRRFRLPIELRIEIQYIKFGSSRLSKSNILVANQKFYEYAWSLKSHCCEETTRPLNYSAAHVSHILSRQNKPEMAHDLRNFNILSVEKHHQWEDSKARKRMLIYPINQIIIEELIKDYNCL